LAKEFVKPIIKNNHARWLAFLQVLFSENLQVQKLTAACLSFIRDDSRPGGFLVLEKAIKALAKVGQMKKRRRWTC
jgi:hypothetical protein